MKALTLTVMTWAVLGSMHAAGGDEVNKGGFEMVYDPPAKPFTNLQDGSLCRDAPSKSTHMSTDKTLAELLGPGVSKIKVHYHSEKWDTFAKAKAQLAQVLAEKPKTVYRYQPWANAVPKKTFVGTIDYKNDKTGALEIAGIYVCFQDQDGLHWWARLPGPLDGPLFKK